MEEKNNNEKIKTTEEKEITENETEKNEANENNTAKDTTAVNTKPEEKIIKKASPLPIILGAVAVIAIAVIIGSVVLVQSFTPAKRAERQCTSAARFLADLDFEQAVAAYKTALEIDPNNENAVQGLYDAYMAWADNLKNEGNDAEAIKRYEDAIATNPAIPDAYYALADIYIRLNDTDALLKLYEKATASLAGDDASAFKSYLLSKLNDKITELLASGDTDNVLAYLTVVESIDKDSAADIRENVIKELLASGTEEGYRKALDIDPSSEEAYLKLINYYLEKEDYENAQSVIKAGEDAIESDAITAERSEIPYVLANDIKIETDWIKNIVYNDYTFQVIDDNGYKLDSPEISVNKGDCTFTIDSITEEHIDDGMKVITISTTSTIKPVFDVTWDGNFEWYFNYNLPAIDFFDYYSGKLYNSRQTVGDETYGVHTDLLWKNNSYDIYKEKNVTWNNYWDENTYNESNNGWSEIYPSSSHGVYTITVPEDYDGLVMYLKKEAGDCTVEDDYYTDAAFAKRSKEAEDWLAEEHYLLDPDSEGEVLVPDEKYFFRITDESIAEFNK